MKQTRGRMLRRLVSAPLILVLLMTCLARAQGVGSRVTPAQLEQARTYIRRSWHTLTRSNRDLAAAAVDPKFKPDNASPSQAPRTPYRWPVYVARDIDPEAIERSLRALMTPEDFARIRLRQLSAPPRAAEPGLLYLPRPYVVPGGRFNEMYGW